MFTLLQAGQPSGMPNLLFFLGMILVMYFLMFRPQAKRAKEQKKFTEGISVGDQIVTTSGIHGKITAINDNGTINLDLGRGNIITVERSGISMELTNTFLKRTGAIPAK